MPTPAFVLKEPLGLDWQAHPVAFALPAGQALPPGTAVTVHNLTLDTRVPGQVDADGRVWFLADLPAHAEFAFAVEPEALQDCGVRIDDDAAAGELRLASGPLTLALPRVDLRAPAGAALEVVPAPSCWLSGPERVRRGRGLWHAALPVTAVRSAISARGPVFAEAALHYHFADGSDYRITWRLYAGAPVALATETKTVNCAGCWAFDAHANFAPAMAQIRWGEKGGWPLDYASDEHLCRHIFSNHWDLYQDFKEVSFLYRPEGGAGGDAIGVFPVDGEHWEHVVTNIISLDMQAAPAPGAHYRFSLTPGRREFGLFAVPLATTNHEAASGTDGGGAYVLRNRWSFVRLNDVKELVLDWAEPENAALALLGTPARLAELAARVPRHPETYGDLAQSCALFTAAPEVVAAAKQKFFQDLQRLCRNTVTYGPNGGNCNPVMLRPLLHLPLDYGILRWRGALTPAEDRQARAVLAFLAYFTDREDYDFGRHALLPAGHPDDVMSLYKGMRAENMTVDRWVGVGMIGAAFPGHPRAAAWRQAAVDAFEQTMQVLVTEAGAWCEGWGYCRWSLHLLLFFAHALRNGGTDLFPHPRFKSLLRFIVQALGPRNAAYGGKRITPAFGSYGESVDFSGCGFSYLMALAATAYADSDAALARELMWAYQEMGEGPVQKNVGLQAHDRMRIALFADFALPAQEPPRQSRGCPGFGAMFHYRHADGRETSLIARASPHWPHGHADGGSFFLTARGAPLITEAARGTNRGDSLYTSMGSLAHNVITYDGKPVFQYVWPCRQDLVRFQAGERLDYAVLDCRVEQLVLGGERRRGHGDAITQSVDIRHNRHIVHLKPDLFVIYDTLANAPFTSTYRLHGYGTGVSFAANRAHLAGHHGVDLEVVVLLPAAPVFRTQTIVDTHSLEFDNAPEQPYLVVLAPHEPAGGGAPPAECAWDGSRLTLRQGAVSWRLRFCPTAQPGVCEVVLD